MKKNKKLILFFGLFLIYQVAFSQLIPPGNAGEGTGPVGGGAPIGEGISILLLAGTAFSGTKLWKAWNDNKEKLEE